MPFVYATYLNHVTTANPTFNRIKDSSLNPLNLLLQGAPGVLNPGLRQQVLETLGLIPYAKQQTYANALNYALQQLNLGIAAIPYAYPVNLVHRFDSYQVALAAWGNGAMDSRPDGWFEHSFRVSWASSNGNMQSLAQIWNREQVTFIAHMMPSRQDVPEYVEYLERIEALVAVVNHRHGTTDWMPIDLKLRENLDEAIAAYKHYDLLMVNAMFDGMNLVAKEGPMVNERAGVSILSENTGAHDGQRARVQHMSQSHRSLSKTLT